MLYSKEIKFPITPTLFAKKASLFEHVVEKRGLFMFFDTLLRYAFGFGSGHFTAQLLSTAPAATAERA